MKRVFWKKNAFVLLKGIFTKMGRRKIWGWQPAVLFKFFLRQKERMICSHRYHLYVGAIQSVSDVAIADDEVSVDGAFDLQLVGFRDHDVYLERDWLGCYFVLYEVHRVLTIYKNHSTQPTVSQRFPFSQIQCYNVKICNVASLLLRKSVTDQTFYELNFFPNQLNNRKDINAPLFCPNKIL